MLRSIGFDGRNQCPEKHNLAMQPLFFSPTFPLVVALAVIVMAGVWELFTYKVPNTLTLTACLGGLGYALAKSAIVPEADGGFVSAITGLVVGGAILLPLRNKTGLGSGCVKALAAFGVWIGCAFGLVMTIKLLTISCIVGMIVLSIYARSIKHKTNTAHAQFPITIGVVSAVVVLLGVS